MSRAVVGAVAAPNEYQDIDVALIDVPAGRRELDPNWVEALGADMAERGQRTPIEVLAIGSRFRLVAGRHRLAARILHKSPTVRALVKQPADFANEAEIRLAEIVENFMRRELSVLDRAFDVAAWREIFETVRGTVQRGGDRRSKAKLQDATLIGDEALDAVSLKFAANFTDAAQKALGLSKDAIFRALKIARLGDDLRQRISLLPIADNQSELLALVGQPEARQHAIVGHLVAGAANVADAIAILDDAPPTVAQAAWERMSERFSRLKADEQARFFALHEDAIVAWMASR